MTTRDATPCMGGWCAKRGYCPHYHSAASGTHPEPSERLCAPGADGTPKMRPMVWQQRGREERAAGGAAHA